MVITPGRGRPAREPGGNQDRHESTLALWQPENRALPRQQLRGGARPPHGKRVRRHGLFAWPRLPRLRVLLAPRRLHRLAGDSTEAECAFWQSEMRACVEHWSAAGGLRLPMLTSLMRSSTRSWQNCRRSSRCSVSDAGLNAAAPGSGWRWASECRHPADHLDEIYPAYGGIRSCHPGATAWRRLSYMPPLRPCRAKARTGGDAPPGVQPNPARPCPADVSVSFAGCGRARRGQPCGACSCWTLDEEDAKLLANKSGATRLAFALALKFSSWKRGFPGTRASCRRRRWSS